MYYTDNCNLMSDEWTKISYSSNDWYYRNHNRHHCSQFKSGAKCCSLCCQSIDGYNIKSHTIIYPDGYRMLQYKPLIVCMPCVYYHIAKDKTYDSKKCFCYIQNSYSYYSKLNGNRLCYICDDVFLNIAYKLQGQQLFYWGDEVEDNYCKDPLYHREHLCNCRLLINQRHTEYYKLFTDKYLHIAAKENKQKSKKVKVRTHNVKLHKVKQKTHKKIHNEYKEELVVAQLNERDYSGSFNHNSLRPCIIMTHKQKPLSVVKQQKRPPFYVAIDTWANKFNVKEKKEYEEQFPKLKSIPVIKITCGICYEEYEKNKLIINDKKIYYITTTTKCKHQFCTDCLMTWIRRNKSCPMCRRIPL